MTMCHSIFAENYDFLTNVETRKGCNFHWFWLFYGYIFKFQVVCSVCSMYSMLGLRKVVFIRIIKKSDSVCFSNSSLTRLPTASHSPLTDYLITDMIEPNPTRGLDFTAKRCSIELSDRGPPIQKENLPKK